MKPHIITCAITKGGTGKTTTCAAIAQAAKRDGKKVLAIDLDPQAHLTKLLRGDQEAPGAVELILEHADIMKTIQSTPGNFDLIAASEGLTNVNTSRGSSLRLKKALEPIRKQYDLIMIDTSCYISDLLFNALQTSTDVIICLQATRQAVEPGLFTILDTVDQIRNAGGDVRKVHVLINDYYPKDRGNITIREQIRKLIKANGCHDLGTVRHSTPVRDAANFLEPIFDYSPRSNGAKDFAEVYRVLKK